MTKNLNWVSGVLLAGLLALAGCSKAEKGPAAYEINGVQVDWPKLQAAFPANASVDIKDCVSGAAFGIRYGDYIKTLDALDKLRQIPNLTDQQKKVVNDVFEQIKQVASKSPPRQ